MPRILSPQEQVLLQKDTDYINSGIPVWGSRVVYWVEYGSKYVLIYHSGSVGYVTTDITDLGSSRINVLAAESEVHGIWYYLPQSIASVIADGAEVAIDVAQGAGQSVAQVVEAAAASIGNTIANLIKPTTDALMIPLIIIGVIGMIYLIKKG